MAKIKTKFLCSECGHETSGWMGRCPGCGQFNTMVEERIVTSAPAGRAGRSGGWAGQSGAAAGANIVTLDEVTSGEGRRFATGMAEFDRVLGGGLVDGSLVLVGGDPGIGKSTLLLQACEKIGKQGTALYVSGEESPSQVKLRAERLGIDGSRIRLLSETSFDIIAATIAAEKPALTVIDSIQTMYAEELSSAPGTVSQVREVAGGLLRLAKHQGGVIVLVGHVTKDGAIAGPRVLEHMVDTVLYFEGERQGSYRILRATKNRFGATDELGIFEMRDTGLVGVENASQAMLAGRPLGVPGSVVAACVEGTRPILVEIQALLNASAYGTPQRMSQGIDRNRIIMLTAVMDRRLKLGLSNMDSFLNVVGGLRIDETAADLAVVCAIASTFRDQAIRPDTVVFGEVGLSGEIRPVTHVDRRVVEAGRMGFASCILPGGCRRATERIRADRLPELLFVDNIHEALDVVTG
ncbi:MAG: DNA repair protein RadA [Clostridiaceae bacterium]|nr:DNA repair protein RadA [Clostridiaceae bacterium]